MTAIRETDTHCALSFHGVKLVAACYVYDGRLNRQGCFGRDCHGNEGYRTLDPGGTAEGDDGRGGALCRMIWRIRPQSVRSQRRFSLALVTDEPST